MISGMGMGNAFTKLKELKAAFQGNRAIKEKITFI